jgi:prepilin-type processing-associated H-X9-DG protein
MQQHTEDIAVEACHRAHRWRRPGFTVFEVLIVFGVIMLVLSLLLPAMLSARESARRIQCQNNMKQMSLALHNYHDMYSVFPPGYIARNVSPTDPAAEEAGPGWAWSVMLLPFMDQAALYNSMDFSTDPMMNVATTATMISPYRCPTDMSGSMNYVASFGFGSLTESPGKPPGPGVFYRNSKVPEFDIRDGTSTTFLIGERAELHEFVRDQPAMPAGAVWLATPLRSFRHSGTYVVAGSVEGQASFVLANVGQDTPFPVHAVHCRTNHVASFSSRHPGGANFGMADGAVVFVSSEIDYETYRRLGQRSDRQVAELPREF